MSQFKLEDADILIDLANQTLSLPKHNKFYVVSTGKMELGNKKIRVKPHVDGIGLLRNLVCNLPKCSFIARQPTGEVYSSELAAQFPERDWILSRILWLDGLEEGFNKGEGHDTMQRYIYIHGTPDKEPMGFQCHMGVFECVMKKSLNCLI